MDRYPLACSCHSASHHVVGLHCVLRSSYTALQLPARFPDNLLPLVVVDSSHHRCLPLPVIAATSPNPHPPPTPSLLHQALAAEFFTNGAAKQLWKNHATFLLNRVNPYTGKAHKDDPTIMARPPKSAPGG